MKSKIFWGCSIACVLSSIWSYQMIWGKPASFNLFVERVIFQKALADPEFITHLGVFSRFPFDFFNSRLTDISARKNKQCLDQTRRNLDILHRYEKTKLSEQERLTYDILELTLQKPLEEALFEYGGCLNGYAIGNSPYPVNQINGVQNFLPDFLTNVHRVENKKGAFNYIKRLNQWDKKFGDLIDELRIREENGVVPPRFVLDEVIEDLREFVSVPGAQNLLYCSLQQKLNKIGLSQRDREELLQKAELAIETKVYPVYFRLISFLEKQKERATNHAGVWKFPNGEAYYAHCLKHHTTTDLSSDEVHSIGLSEVERIQNEMRALLDRLDYSGLTVSESMRKISNDPRFFYADTEDARAHILADFRKIFLKMGEKLNLLFEEIPQGELQIKAVPDYKAKKAPLAYYEPGDLMGHRPGIFYANTSEMGHHTKFSMPSLAYHEGMPGRHFQTATALELKGLPTLRHLVSFAGFQKGWALYCEQLASEYGFNLDPYSELGRLQLELLRAARLVVDTAIHSKRWSREQAIEYLMETTGKRMSEMAVEVDRYVVSPGQACSYKVGMMKILELREKMKRRLGPDFDIKCFHSLVLKNGAVPFHLLERQIDEYSSKRPSSF